MGDAWQQLGQHSHMHLVRGCGMLMSEMHSQVQRAAVAGSLGKGKLGWASEQFFVAAVSHHLVVWRALQKGRQVPSSKPVVLERAGTGFGSLLARYERTALFRSLIKSSLYHVLTSSEVYNTALHEKTHTVPTSNPQQLIQAWHRCGNGAIGTSWFLPFVSHDTTWQSPCQLVLWLFFWGRLFS